MKAWPNFLNLILIVIIVLMFMGVIDTRHPVKVSDQIMGFMKQSNAKAALVIGDDGHITPIKQDGTGLKECGIGSDPKLPPCEGLGGTKGVVQSSQMYNIFRVKGSTCILLIDGAGKAYEFCF